jgi:hypothetical protein
MEGMQSGEGRKNEAAVPESIRAAALRYDGETYTGLTHGEAYDELKKAHPEGKIRTRDSSRVPADL